jgi:FolB domain-containing protein
MDRILIHGLRVSCIIGVREKERREKQDVLISVSLSADLRGAGASDRLEDTVDYSRLKKRIIARVEASRYQLLEALAQAVAEVCLEEPGVHRARVRIEKPAGMRNARSVGVEIVRKKRDSR